MVEAENLWLWHFGFHLVFASLVLSQGLLISVDELFFHRRRQMPFWERLGHPLDTLTLIAALGSLVFYGPSMLSICLSVFSCLFVIKDEWVHRKLCGLAEQMLHALLFILHGSLLLAAHAMILFEAKNPVSGAEAQASRLHFALMGVEGNLSLALFDAAPMSLLLLLAAIGLALGFFVVQLFSAFRKNSSSKSIQDRIAETY